MLSSKSNRKSGKRARLAALMTGLLIGSGAFAPAVIAQEPDTLVIARSIGGLNSLDPSRAFCDTCQIYLSSVYESLVTLASDNKSLAPNLAESWEISDDLTQFTFHIKPDAVFSDGSPVEAKDVAWSFQRLLNLKGSPSFLMDGMESVEALDAKTVKVTVSKPNSEFINKVSAPYAAIINSDVAIEAGALADASAATADDAEGWFLETSAGSGPFVLKNYSPESELRLIANANYYGDQPAFDSVVITNIQDSVSQAQALESGAVDIAMQIDADTMASMNSDEVITEIVPSFNFVYIAFSPAATRANGVLTPEVREALTYALDYDGIMDFTVGGNGAKQSAPIPNGFPGTSDLPLRTQDVAKAKQMLADAGYADGFSLIAGYPNDNVYGVDLNLMMQKVQQDLAAVNVSLELQPMTYAVWRDELTGEGLPVTGVYYAPDYFGSGQYVDYFSMIEGTPWASRAGGTQPELVVNATEAELYQKALASSGETSESYYHQLAEEMIGENIIIPLVSPNLVLAFRADIEGVRYSACCNLPLAELSRK